MMKADGNLLATEASCKSCPLYHAAHMKKLGVDMEDWDYVVALAGNPNTGKSTVFNALTGLHQHTGNWPGKTIARAEGGYAYANKRYKVVDLPGTYSLLAASVDEEIARDFVLFGQPTVTVVVVDATRLQHNLNLVLQVLEITDRVVVCLNLIDEAIRHGLRMDHRRLARDLGVPVVPTVARSGVGLAELSRAIHEVATGKIICHPYRVQSEPPELKQAIKTLTEKIEKALPDLPNARWIALRLLDGDERIATALRKGELGDLRRSTVGETDSPRPADEPTEKALVEEILASAQSRRSTIGYNVHERYVEAIYTDAARLADRAVTLADEKPRFDVDRAIDRLVTSRIWGFPLMIGLFAFIFWLTISGANIPSAWLSALFIDTICPMLREGAAAVGLPWWLRGLLIDGMYLTVAWVVSVMLPPMAIFFPLFTLLEDFGYLPRVAFNLDNIFKKAGAHGKQALSMMMCFGCNAAGIIATRIIDSPRERLIAIITNNFALCNGRWPTQIILATLFIGGLFPSPLAGLISSAVVVGVTILGVLLTFAVSWFLSRTLLKGEVSTFSLELPPYRPPRFWQTIYTSMIDRTIFVLWRAVVFALPAGAVIWLVANVHIGNVSLAQYLIGFLDPFGILLGMNGIIILAFIIAIPANEIVIPTVLMLIVLVTGAGDVGAGAGVLFEPESESTLKPLLASGGWTLLTAISVMIFSLVHNPCSTTIYTIYKETGSVKWTAIASLLPLVLGIVLTFFVAQLWRLLAELG